MSEAVVNVTAGIGAFVITMIVVFMAACFGGTLIWLIYPATLPSIFPGLVTSGAIAAELSWWSSVCITWFCNVLLKTTVTKKD